jgi:predicted RNase H-like nuclease (RuvC/YqgF family)
MSDQDYSLLTKSCTDSDLLTVTFQSISKRSPTSRQLLYSSLKRAPTAELLKKENHNPNLTSPSSRGDPKKNRYSTGVTKDISRDLFGSKEYRQHFELSPHTQHKIIERHTQLGREALPFIVREKDKEIEYLRSQLFLFENQALQSAKLEGNIEALIIENEKMDQQLNEKIKEITTLKARVLELKRTQSTTSTENPSLLEKFSEALLQKDKKIQELELEIKLLQEEINQMEKGAIPARYKAEVEMYILEADSQVDRVSYENEKLKEEIKELKKNSGMASANQLKDEMKKMEVTKDGYNILIKNILTKMNALSMKGKISNGELSALISEVEREHKCLVASGTLLEQPKEDKSDIDKDEILPDYCLW